MGVLSWVEGSAGDDYRFKTTGGEVGEQQLGRGGVKYRMEEVLCERGIGEEQGELRREEELERGGYGEGGWNLKGGEGTGEGGCNWKGGEGTGEVRVRGNMMGGCWGHWGSNF